MKKLIIGATIPNKLQLNSRGVKHLNPRLQGFPGIITALPEGDNVNYLLDYKDLCELDDNKVEFYMLEICCELFSLNEKFIKWINSIDKNKIIIGGSAISCLREKDLMQFNPGKIINGRCDNIFDTIAQPGLNVKGIIDYNKLPRYDLFNINHIIKDYNCAVNGFNEYGIATSSGCLCNCDFCYQSIIGNSNFTIKPLDYLEAECKSMVNLFGTVNKCFLYDANFTMSKDWKEALSILHKNKFSDNYSFFASANTINIDDIEFMKKNDVYNITIGLEDINKHYSKNDNIQSVCKELYKNNISVSLGYIINPEDVITYDNERDTIDRLNMILYDLKPINVFKSYLRVTYGTKLYRDYLKRDNFNMNEYMDTEKETDIQCVNAMIKNLDRSTEIVKNQNNVITSYNNSKIYKAILNNFYKNAYRS